MRKIVLLLVLLVFITVSYAGVPSKIRYNGRLKSYQTLVNDNVKMNFKLYDSASGGNLIWESGNQNIPVSSGVFTYELNPNLNTKVDLRKGMYLELWVEDKELQPREELMSQPYSLYAGNGVPPGTVISYAGNKTQMDGYLFCDGTSYSTADYPELADAMAGLYGNSNSIGSTFFVPNFQGMFLRGAGSQSVNYPSAANPTVYVSSPMGQMQGDAIRNITGEFNARRLNSAALVTSGVFGAGASLGSVGASGESGSASPINFNASRVVPTGNENRPANYAVKYFIKY